ncbi:hypothetical protein B0F90DRAFT_1708149 [Multifurca ochricompacta]|uniref:Uncharacterized protein n=1 Tax=Multifurca ochricompacta TaxID=376703 RepID=A0AAD4M6C3_9AGAM|nr:hypothetical protein B0F90DRAFT_1708149 [Multifurca ochricompacta]
MQRARNQLVKRQTTFVPVPSASGVTGGATAVSGVGLGSSLLLGPSASAVASVSNALNPNDPVITITSSSTPIRTDTASSTSPASSSSSSSSTSSVSTGAIIGISFGVFFVAVGAMFAVYTYFKKRTVSQARKPVARGPPPASRGNEGAKRNGSDKQWGQLEDGNDHWEVKDKSPSRGVNLTSSKTPESDDKFGLFEKDPSVRSVSDEKANLSDNHTFDPSTMPNFAKYHPGLAEELSNVPPVRPFAPRSEGPPVVSWGGETVNGSFLSIHASASDTMSPTAVTARQTPQTTDSAQHRWESAEVLIMDEQVKERLNVDSDATQNPFNDDSVVSRTSNAGDDSGSRKSGGNPFFNASQHDPFSDRSSRSRKSSISTIKRSRSNSISSGGTIRAGASENALLSIIAALDTTPIAPDDLTNRVSMQTVATSVYTNAEGTIVPATPKAF